MCWVELQTVEEGANILWACRLKLLMPVDSDTREEKRKGIFTHSCTMGGAAKFNATWRQDIAPT
jgi:hypothetical protein